MYSFFKLKLIGTDLFYMKPSKPSSVISFSASASEGTVFNITDSALVREYLGTLGLCVVAVVMQDQVDIDMTSDFSTQDIPVLPPKK